MRPGLARLCWTLTALYWLALFTGTHIPAPKLPPIRINDKTIHFVGYGLLAGSILVSLKASRRLKPTSGITVPWPDVAATRCPQLRQSGRDGARFQAMKCHSTAAMPRKLKLGMSLQRADFVAKVDRTSDRMHDG